MSHLNPTEVQFLRNLVSGGGPCRRKVGRASHRFLADHRLGIRWGSEIGYSVDDLGHAADILRAAGVSITEAPPADGVRDRASASLPGVSEKSGSVAPHAGEVAFKPLTAGCGFEGFGLSPGLPGYHVWHHADVARIDADGCLVVENLETFKQLERYRWIFDDDVAQRRVIAVFRGDNVYKPDSASKALDARTDPVWSFPDLDPAGLGIASQLPRLAGLVFPWASLEHALNERRMIELFESQMPQWEATVERCTHPDIVRAWALIRRRGFGLNQEAMRSLTSQAPVPVSGSGVAPSANGPGALFRSRTQLARPGAGGGQMVPYRLAPATKPGNLE